MSRFISPRYAALVLVAFAMMNSAAYAQSAFDDPGARGGGVQGGDLKPVADKVEAGGVALGASSQVVVLLRNDDVKPLKTGAINLYPSSNITASIGENQCAQDAIQPGEVCAISIQVKGLQQGKYRIEMLIRHDGRTKLLTTTINGDVEAGTQDVRDLVSDLETIPKEIDFGSLDESRSQVKAVIIRNKTSKPITITDIEIEAGSQSGFTLNSNCKELQTGAACVASIGWAPQQKGPSTGTMIVRHTGATGVSTIDLTGTFNPTVAAAAEVFPEAMPGKGLLVSSLEDIDFGSGIAQSSSITASLVNIGDMPLTLTGLGMTNSENGIKIEKTGCQTGSVLAPLEACPLTMTWEPVREGNVVDDVRVSHTGARGILVMPLRGSATKAINKDSKAIMLGGHSAGDAVLKNIRPLSIDDIEDGDIVQEAGDKTTVRKSSEGKKSTESSSANSGSSKGKSSSSSDISEQDFMPQQVDVRGVLDGYIITSYSAKRAIVAGPGGSRVIFDGEQTVIGGVLWEITMRPNAIEFKNGNQKVLLLFDKSLSSVNLTNGQSTSGGSTTTTTGTGSSTSTSSSSTTTQ